LSQYDEVEGGSICNFAAAIVEATVEVEVEASVLEVFPSSQLTPLSVFSRCESSVDASFSQAEVSILGYCEVSRPLSRCRGRYRSVEAAVEVSTPPSKY
jgi:hypothetical protein